MNVARRPLFALQRAGIWKCLAMPMVVVVTLLLSSGCDFPYGSKNDPPEPQTLILEVRVNPDPVAVGDTTILTAVIEDSLDQSFQFRWVVGGTPTQFTEDNQLAWIAPAEAAAYTGVVTADNGDMVARPAKREFVVQVVE